MASGDTKTEAMLNALGNGGSADEFRGCCNTKTQQYILDAIDRVQNVEDEVEELKNNPDVVDIVDTYADLQAYDTSTLTDKDIIRVLSDSTHSGNSTYYRFTKNPDTWTFIGEIASAGGVKELTADDYNYDDGNTGSFNTIGLWLLDDGIYKLPSTTQVKVKGGLTGSQVAVLNAEIANLNYHYLIKQNNHCWFLKDISTYNDQIKDYSPYYYCGLNKADGNYYRELDAQLLPYGKVSQTTGNSQNHVMSQNAVTSMVFADPATQEKIKIGAGTSASEGSDSIEIGHNAYATGDNAVALGLRAGADQAGGIAIGFGSYAHGYGRISLGAASGSNDSTAGVMTIGTGNTLYGYNSSNYRLLTGLYDPQDDHDAATKGYVDGLVGNVAAALNAINNGTQS